MNKKILVAEDDSAILEVIKIILEGESYKIISTDNQKNIYTLISAHKPSIILLDIWLSGCDGGEIAKNLKSRNDTKNIPLIIISANNETEKISKESGAEGFLLKPFNIDDLINIVNKFIQ